MTARAVGRRWRRLLGALRSVRKPAWRSGRGSWRVGLALVALLAGACASLSRSSSGAPAPVSVWVYNQSLAAVHVYAVHESLNQSLGVVMSQDSATYVVPQSVVIGTGGVRLVARPMAGGSGTYVSPELFPRPGDQLRLRLQEPLSQSFVSIH